MRIHLDKIASSTRNVSLPPSVVVGPEIPAVPGAVIAVRVLDDKSSYNQIENVHGRMMTYRQGDIVAGVLGARSALRGYSGVVPASVRPGDVLHLLNLGGVIGVAVSGNPEVGPPARVEVLGSVLVFPELGRRVGKAANIFPGPVPLSDALAPMPPCVFVVGTCMHAGKTAAACTLVRGASARGLRVVATKVTGVSLRRDTLEMQDNGALTAYTFADVGFPSTIGVDVVRAARGCLNAAASHEPDLVVVELGDGLMGEYGVKEVLSAPDLAASARAIVLAANDPVGAWGGDLLLQELSLKADIITGPATDNDAGCRGISGRTEAVPINARRSPDLFVETLLTKLRLQPRALAALEGP